MRQPKNYALVAVPPVRWFIDREPEVKRAIQAFCRDEADRNYVDVAGPPTVEDILKLQSEKRRQVELPTIRLSMRKITHHLTGEAGIEVSCSDADRDLLITWHNQAHVRAAVQQSVGVIRQ